MISAPCGGVIHDSNPCTVAIRPEQSFNASKGRVKQPTRCGKAKKPHDESRYQRTFCGCERLRLMPKDWSFSPHSSYSLTVLIGTVRTVDLLALRLQWLESTPTHTSPPRRLGGYVWQVQALPEPFFTSRKEDDSDASQSIEGGGAFPTISFSLESPRWRS